MSDHHISGDHEHEGEPIPGLPELPPEGERILWQGSPRWTTLARRAFHVRKLAVYFLVLAVWRVATVAGDQGAAAAAAAGVWAVLLAAVALGLIGLFAWLVQRTTIYTLTNRRLAMRFGVALPMTINLPLRLIQGVDMSQWQDDSGNLAIRLDADEHLSYLVLWPHARPWHFSQVEPMLRCVPRVTAVAELLSGALQGRELPTAAGLETGTAEDAQTAEDAPVYAGAAR